MGLVLLVVAGACGSDASTEAGPHPPTGVVDAVERGLADGTLCEGEPDVQPDVEVLTDGVEPALVVVTCIRHVYNTTYQLAFYDGEVRPVQVPTFDASAGVVVE